MPSQPRARRGCCFKGCLTLFILVLLLAGAAGYAVWSVAGPALREFTSDKPVALKVERPTDKQFDDAAFKFNDLSNALTIGEEKAITFTAGDLNALIARHPGYFFPSLKNKVRFDFSDNLLGTELCLPLGGLMPPSAPSGWLTWMPARPREWTYERLRNFVEHRVANRWFNGRLKTFFELANGEVTLSPRSADVNGRSIGEGEFRQATEEGWFGDWNKFVNESLVKQVMLGGKDPKDAFSGVSSARITGDGLVITTKTRAR